MTSTHHIELIKKELEDLEDHGYISNVIWTTHKDEVKNLVITRKSDGKSVVLVSNLQDSYFLTFEDYYQEFTDHLQPGESFDSHIKWFMPFVRAYLKHEYREVIYTKKSNGGLISKRLYFNNKNLGRKSLISPAHIRNISLRLQPWRIQKTVSTAIK